MADQAIVQGWTNYAAAEAQRKLQSNPGFQMANMVTMMANMWQQHILKTYEEDKKIMDKFVPQEGDVMNVMKDFTPQAQAKMMGSIQEMRKEMFNAMRSKDKQKVAEYWGKINSVTDQLKIFNEGLATHKKNHDENNYSAASNHFDLAQFTTGGYDLILDPESGQVQMAMFERDNKTPILMNASEFGRTTMVKQYEAFDKLEQFTKKLYNEAVTFENFDFDDYHEQAESFVDNLLSNNSVMASFAYDDGMKNGGKNAIWKITEDEALKRDVHEKKAQMNPLLGPYVPESKKWTDPFSDEYKPDQLRTYVKGVDGEGNYIDGGLMKHIETQFNKYAKHYKKKQNIAENKKRTSKTENFTMHRGLGGGADESGLGIKKNVEMHKSQLTTMANKITNGTRFSYGGHSFAPATDANGVTKRDANGFPMWIHPTNGNEITSEALIYVLDDDQGTFTLMPGIFGKFEKPKL